MSDISTNLVNNSNAALSNSQGGSTTGIGSLLSNANKLDEAAATAGLDDNAFLQLMVAQLRYQDPSNPADTEGMMTQATQLASMERMESLLKLSQENSALQKVTIASSLVGQKVIGTSELGEELTGIVDSVEFTGSMPMVNINGIKFPLDSIKQVGVEDTYENSLL